jgi:anti-sigma factor RsiW
MKSHSYIQSRLLLLLDQELNPREQRQVLQHLRRCPGCRTLLRQMREEYLDRHDAVPVLSPFIWTRMQARLQERSSRRRPITFGLALLKPAVIVFLLFLSLWTGHYLGSIEQAPVSVVSEEELVYRTFGMDATEPFAGHTLAGAVQAVYDHQ